MEVSARGRKKKGGKGGRGFVEKRKEHVVGVSEDLINMDR